MAAEWSPEGEVLALVSGHAQLLLMNKVRKLLTAASWSSANAVGWEVWCVSRQTVFAHVVCCLSLGNTAEDMNSTK